MPSLPVDAFGLGGAANGLGGVSGGMPVQTPEMAQLLAANLGNAGMGGVGGGAYGANNGQPQSMAEVYQAAYTAAFYAQQQQLQNLMRMQQVPGLMAQNLSPQQLQQFAGLDGGMGGLGGNDGGHGGGRMNGRDDRSRVGRTMGRNRSGDRGDSSGVGSQ